jgi:hypothetical protein
LKTAALKPPQIYPPQAEILAALAEDNPPQEN